MSQLDVGAARSIRIQGPTRSARSATHWVLLGIVGQDGGRRICPSNGAGGLADALLGASRDFKWYECVHAGRVSVGNTPDRARNPNAGAVNPTVRASCRLAECQLSARNYVLRQLLLLICGGSGVKIPLP